MTLSRAAQSAARRSSLVKRSYHASSLQKGGMSPPLPPFARSPPRAAPLTENSDILWDDGVAPELALDFDAHHISLREALWTWATAFGLFGVLYQTLKALDSGDDNPALSHATDAVDQDYSDYNKSVDK